MPDLLDSLTTARPPRRLGTLATDNTVRVDAMGVLRRPLSLWVVALGAGVLYLLWTGKR